MTIGHYIGKIKAGLKLLNKDEQVSDRYIFSELLTMAKTIISRKIGERSLDNDENLYKWSSKPLELREESIVDTDIVAFKSCNSVMRSKEKLPELVYSRYGASIRFVTNLDKSIKIDKGDFSQLLRDKDRMIKDTKPKFYIQDGYLYIINHKLEAVYYNYLSLTPLEEGVGNEECLSALEQEMYLPHKLEADIISATVSLIAQTNRRIVQDENPNMDSNQKGQTVE